MLSTLHRPVAALVAAGGLWGSITYRDRFPEQSLFHGVYFVVLGMGIVSALLAATISSKAVKETCTHERTHWSLKLAYAFVLPATVFLLTSPTGVVWSVLSVSAYTGTSGFFYRALRGFDPEDG